MLQNILHFGCFHLSWISMKKSETATDIEKAKKIIIFVIIIIIIFSFVKRSSLLLLLLSFLACSRARASKVFSLRADCGRVIVYPGLKQWERPRHNIFGVCTRLAGGVCMSTSANSSASKHLTVTKIVWKIVYVTFDYLISHFFKILSLEFMANLFRDFRASVSLKVFHYRLRGKWCQYDLEIN